MADHCCATPTQTEGDDKESEQCLTLLQQNHM